MMLGKINLNSIKATNTELRNFGLMMAGMFGLFFGLLIPWLWNLVWPLWPWIVSTIFGFLGLVRPHLLKPVFTLWMKFAQILGWFNTRLILSVIFYVIIFPTGMLLKLFGKDPLCKTYDKTLSSYRITSKQPSKKNLEKPF